jgi:hypothetical protein
MARLSEMEKKAVPRRRRGIPGKSGTGSYPMPDAAHARSALGFWKMHHPGQPAPFAAKARRIIAQG